MILFYLSPFLTSFATSLSIELTVQPKLTQVLQVDSMTQVINTREVWVNEPLCYMVTSEGEVVNLEGLCDCLKYSRKTCLPLKRFLCLRQLVYLSHVNEFILRQLSRRAC